MNTPAVLKYSKMFEHLDLSNIQRYLSGVGPNGYDYHSMIKELIVYALEGYRSIPQLIWEQNVNQTSADIFSILLQEFLTTLNSTDL